MAKEKFYAVRVGRNVGVYNKWEEAQKQVKGYSGADYKSFLSKEEAESYVFNESIVKSSVEISETVEEVNTRIEAEKAKLKENEVMAFVDGSYSTDADGREKYSFGAVLITQNAIENLYKAFVWNQYMDSRNIAGEIAGVKEVISWAVKTNKSKIKIFYDYEGIEKWALGQWKANSITAKDYKKFFDEHEKKINIEFEHVKAHTGIKYNEQADKLAKIAISSQCYKTYQDGSVYFWGYSKEEWIQIVLELKLLLWDKSTKDEEIIIEEEIKEYHKRLIICLGGQKVVINCYSSKKSYVQGKSDSLFEMIISRGVEKLSTEKEVIDTLKARHAISVENDEIEKLFSKLLPDFKFSKKEVKLKNSLLTAVFNTMVTYYMPDYTQLIFPLLRGIEFYLHRILGDLLGHETERKNGANKFCYFNFNKQTEMYEYKYQETTKKLSKNQIEYLNELYNRYNKIRHPYFHWSNNSINTQVITNIDEAHRLLREGLKFINNYYIIF